MLRNRFSWYHSEGIQRGHMALHARQVAIAAVAARMVADGKVRLDRAEEILREIRSSPK